MKLFKLLHGKSKKRLKPVMIDSEDKCKRYRDQLLVTAQGNGTTRHCDIVPAEPGETVWRIKRKGPWVGYDATGPVVLKPRPHRQ